MSHILDEITKTSIQLMLKEPFYGHFFSRLLKDTNESTKSIALSLASNQMMKLMVNPEYWKNPLGNRKQTQPFTEKELAEWHYGMIKHQVLHVVFKHILRSRDFGNKQLFNIAADLSVNQYIEQRQLLDEASKLEDFPDFKLDRGQSVDYYYKRLMEELDEMDKMSSPFAPQSPSQDDSDDDASNSQMDNQEGGGESDDDSNQQNDDQSPFNQSQQRLKDLMEQEHDEHQHWHQFDEMSKAEQSLLDRQINDSIEKTIQRLEQKSRGNLPAGLEAYIANLLESLKPNVNWRRVLRLFTASSSRTRIKNTIRRPSRRYGTSPGIKIQRHQKILVAIDTSGSVSDDELKEFFGELHHIWKQGAELCIVECDAQVQDHYFYNGKPPEKITGRGGTDFNPPIEFANEEYRPDAIVYFTDGYAPAPEVISRKPILWMISSNGIGEDTWDFLPGRKAKMIKQV